MVYDFYELLGRGIIAARTGRTQDALKYLRLAVKLEPDSVRGRLWQAAAAETAEQQQSFLQEALSLNPQLLVARVLLDRLHEKEVVIPQGAQDFALFVCRACGGKQRFDPDALGLVCTYCHKTETLAAQNVAEAEAPLEAALQRDSGNWAMLEGQVNCGACGAQLSISATRSTHACPFCGSEQITTQSATPGLVAPVALVPFQQHADDIQQRLSAWWAMPPEALTRLLEANQVALAPVYLPFWTFDARVQIRCALGRRVPTATYSAQERVIVKRAPGADKSWFECDFDDWLVYGGRRADAKTIAQVGPFDTKAGLGYRPEMLAGWQAEVYQVALEDAAVEAHKQMRDRAFQRAAKRLLFIEPSDLLMDDVCVLDQTCKLILLPVWIARRAEQGKVQQTLINGQTGKIAGYRPGWWDRLFG